MSGSQDPTPVATRAASTVNLAAPVTSHPASARQSPVPAAFQSQESLKGPQQGVPAHLQGPVLTGAAAMAEEQQRAREQASSVSNATSPNPAAGAKTLLSTPNQSMSRPVDAPMANMTQPQTSRVPSIPMTAEPMQIDSSPRTPRQDPDSVTDPRLTAPETNGTNSLAVPQTERANKAFSYPPRADQIDGAGEGPSRSMTLPGKSPGGAKKHRCQHCGTEFTRHHNLKSHLLTHSQEKPFECNRCDQKFRRLHDLKRHTKLHTGERPHTCNKCGRAFARGDALARHSKGPGGCAGRRGSGGEDDLVDGDEEMDGVEYDGESATKRRKSEQVSHSRKRSLNAMADSTSRQHSMTYPGVAPAVPNVGNHAPPQPAPPSISSSHLGPRIGGGSSFPGHMQAPASVFAQGGMTESPKPLSPGQEQARRLSAGLPMPGRQRSPSLAQHQLSRSSAVNSPSVNALPSLGSISSDRPPSSLASSNATSGSRSKVPPTITTSTAYPGQGPPSASSTNPPSATSQHRSSGGSLREVMNPPVSADYMPRSEHEAMMRHMQEELQNLNQRLNQFDQHVRRLEVENAQLRGYQEGAAQWRGQASQQPGQMRFNPQLAPPPVSNQMPPSSHQ